MAVAKSGPLAGLKVVEFAGLGPCPLAGQMLGDLGADVILIERKSGKSDPTDINNRSKRRIAVNLKSEEGLEAAMRLVERADVVIEGFRPGVMEKLGLGPQDCHARNPRLVFGRMTGWGQEGPLSSSAGHDINYLAMTGALHAIGRKGEQPVPPLNLAADYAGGTMFLLLGVLSALYEAQRSGKGQVVDAAMVDGVPALMGLFHSFMARGQWVDRRESNLLDGGAPFYRCYETSDGKYLSVGPLEPQFFAELVKLAGLPADCLQTQYDVSTWRGMHATCEDIFLSRTREEWEEIFEGSDACVAPVLGLEEAFSHPANVERKVFVDVGGVVQASPAPRFDRTAPAIPRPPAAPGEHGDKILAEAGYSANEIAELRGAKILL
ncbi:MAG: CoA transferase [Nitratireductor sp.]|nr:CoA transferase [Nitratireductor sp.]